MQGIAPLSGFDKAFTGKETGISEVCQSIGESVSVKDAATPYIGSYAIPDFVPDNEYGEFVRKRMLIAEHYR